MNTTDYSTVSDSLSNSDWITITTTDAGANTDNGWYSVNWGPTTKKVLDPDKFFCPALAVNLYQSKISIPDRIPECTRGLFSIFAPGKRPALKRLFATKGDAKWVLSSFNTKIEIERRLFKFIVKEMYSGELNAVAK